MKPEENNVKDLLTGIRNNLSQISASQKDEVAVMKAMLNDPTYSVDIYDKAGKVGTYCPYNESRSMISSVISKAAKIPQAEAKELAESHVFSTSEAASMVGLSKEFINTYLDTGRKLPLGGREKSNVSLSIKRVEDSVKPYNKIAGKNSDGSSVYEKATTHIPAHTSIKVHGSCPTWVK